MRQGTKLDKIDDLRVDLARIDTRLTTACDELQRTKTKLDRVHNWVIGVGAVVAFLVFVVQIALRVWPTTAPVAPAQVIAPANPPSSKL